MNAVRYPSRDYVDSNGATIENMVAQGVVIEADTLAELAEKRYGRRKAQASIDGYNAVVRGEKEDEFGFKADNQADVELTEGPRYACKKVVTVHHTMGGLKINVNTEKVLNTSGEVIEGLLACGEITGGIHGANRLGGNACGLHDIRAPGRPDGREQRLIPLVRFEEDLLKERHLRKQMPFALHRIEGAKAAAGAWSCAGQTQKTMEQGRRE